MATTVNIASIIHNRPGTCHYVDFLDVDQGRQYNTKIDLYIFVPISLFHCVRYLRQGKPT